MDSFRSAKGSYTYFDFNINDYYSKRIDHLSELFNELENEAKYLRENMDQNDGTERVEDEEEIKSETNDKEEL